MKTLSIQKQPNDVTCGPTCLNAVYTYYNKPLVLQTLIDEIPSLRAGGTLAVFLACDALRRGFSTKLYVYNIQLFDPTWFGREPSFIRERLIEQATYKDDSRLQAATTAYVDYLDLGGELCYEDLTKELIADILIHLHPILTGLCATYLYDCARERDVSAAKCIYDDVHGTVTGHFVVLTHFNAKLDQIHIADPYHDNPLFRKSHYTVAIQKVINAIMLGILTYDANLLVILPKESTS